MGPHMPEAQNTKHKINNNDIFSPKFNYIMDRVPMSYKILNIGPKWKIEQQRQQQRGASVCHTLFVCLSFRFKNLKQTMENDHVFAYLEQVLSSDFLYSILYHGAQIFDSIIDYY